MRPPLFAAAELGLTEVVELLISSGADATTIHRDWSAATEADASDCLELAARLVTLGAPASSRLAHGYSQLHRAARRGDVTAALDGLGRDQLDPVDAGGETPLMLAINHRRERAAAALLAAGANANFSHRGHSALCEAAYQDSRPDEPTHFVAQLLAAGADPLRDQPHFFAVNQEWSSAIVLRQLIEAGADVNANQWGQTLLHRIAEISTLEMLDTALEFGGKVEARDRNGRTPLLAAAFSRNPETFARLLERGADASARDASGSGIEDLLDDSAPSEEIRALLARKS